MALPRRRRRWDPQPTELAGVMLASDGRGAFSTEAIEHAAALAADSATTVAVVTLAKVYGFALGLPHPGLLPTKAELKQCTAWVGDAVDDLRRRGVSADGQVASTRHPASTIVKAARARQVAVIVLDRRVPVGWRRVVEGDLLTSVRRKARAAGIDVVTP